jgi:hypothetical protein
LQVEYRGVCSQTLPRKELVMVVNAAATAPAQGCWSTSRHISIESATGDVLCHWDDDDLYHPERLERQLTAARVHYIASMRWENRRYRRCTSAALLPHPRAETGGSPRHAAGCSL